MNTVTEDVNPDVMNEKESRLVKRILDLKSVIVAYSGGVDSSLLAYYAKTLLKENARVITAVSPSLAADDLEAARAQAMLFDWDLTEISTDEFSNESYQKNDSMRCFFCKATLFEELSELARKFEIDNIVYGANVDDNSDFRPGRIAAGQYQVVAPLEEAGLNKQEIRLLARKAGLPSWDRPQNACLSSRVPTHIPVTIEVVLKVEVAERAVKAFGFNQVRVRHHGAKAIVEVGQDELIRFQKEPLLVNKIEASLIDLGYEEVTVDPRGYRQGAASTHHETALAATQS